MLGDTARRGLAAHLAVAQRLIELGFEVLEPVGNHLRYDLAYYVPASSSEKAQLLRIQCKSARLSRDKTCLIFNAYNLGGEGKRQRRGYNGDAEYFGVYCAELNKIYLVPIDIAAYKGEVHLRINPSRNNQMKRVIWASDYEI